MAIKQIFIVESPNDAAFVRLLMKKVALPDAAVEIIDLHKFPDPSNPDKLLRGKNVLPQKLENIKNELEKRYPEVEQIGIILDMDDWSLEKNLQHVNDAIRSTFQLVQSIESEAQFQPARVTQANFEISISCYFTKGYLTPDGVLQTNAGNLDTLLYAIRANPEINVPYADCLKLWRNCVNASDSPITVSDTLFTKMWLDNYLRAKAKSDLGSKQGKSILNDFEAKKTEIMDMLGASIFDLEHGALDGFYAFFEAFKA
jgi:hypothetical protein